MKDDVMKNKETIRTIRNEILELGLMLQEMQKEIHPNHPKDETLDSAIEDLKKVIQNDE